MNRQTVVRRQILIAVAIAAVILILLGVRAYLNSFAHQVKLGRIVEATLGASDGQLPAWKDPAILAEIEAALPRYKTGPGFAAHDHGHESIALVLVDDQGRQISFQLPTGESVLIAVDPRPGIPNGNSWPAPKLLGVLAEHGLPALEKVPMPSAVLRYKLEQWHERFGAGHEH